MIEPGDFVQDYDGRAAIAVEKASAPPPEQRESHSGFLEQLPSLKTPWLRLVLLEGGEAWCPEALTYRWNKADQKILRMLYKNADQALQKDLARLLELEKPVPVLPFRGIE